MTPTSNPGGGATKELFIPAQGRYQDDSMAPYGVIINGAGERAYMKLLIPLDFAALSVAEIILLPQSTQADMHLSLTTAWGSRAGAEAYNVHTEVANHFDIGATVQNQYKSYNINSQLDISPLAIGDIVIIDLTYSATVQFTNLAVAGFRFKYY